MKYACLVYLEDAPFAAMSQSEQDAMVNAALDHDDQLRASGHFVSAEALQARQTAKSIRVRGGKLSATDGPFAETKEHLSGFIVIEASDMNDAIRLASTIPMARVGTIEVRPVEYLERR